MNRPAMYAILILALATTAQAQTVAVSDLPNGTYILTVSASGATLTPATLATVGKVPVVPGPITPGPITPVGNLSDIVAAATASVPDYADKDKHQRSLAFTFTFLGQAVPNDANPATDARGMMQQAGNAALGTDAPKWSAWWSSVNAGTSTMTNAQFKAALPVISSSLTGNLANASSVEAGQYGVQEFGLPTGWLAELFKILLPILLQMLTQLFNQ